MSYHPQVTLSSLCHTLSMGTEANVLTAGVSLAIGTPGSLSSYSSSFFRPTSNLSPFFASGRRISSTPLQHLHSLCLADRCRVAATLRRSENGNMPLAKGSEVELQWGITPLCCSCCSTALWWQQLSRNLSHVSSQHKKKH